MKNIQSKIDNIIKKIESKNDENSQENYDEIQIYIYYTHCQDLFDFLKYYSKIQLNELFIQIAIINNKFGDNQQSLEYVNKSLKIIPNTPSIILFKSGLFASMNKLEDAQKCLLKYKYLIGEDKYCNYIYNTMNIIYYYLLEYEENIILREINSIEQNFPKYFSNNIILYFIKSKIMHKLSDKFKNIDKIRSHIYEKESIENKEKVYNNRQFDADYLYNRDINKENLIKIMIILNPNIIEYKPKVLVDYNFNFHSGFGLFLTLFEIIKIIKLKISIKKYKKISQNFKWNSSNQNISIINQIQKISKTRNRNEDLNNIDINAQECQEKILFLYKSVWLQRFANSKNNKFIINNNQIKESQSLKNIDINFINYKLKTNYYIYKGYYSKMNLKDIIIKNIKFNKDLKELRNSLFNDFEDDFEKCKKVNIMKNNSMLKDENHLIKDKINNRKQIIKNNIYHLNLIQSIQSKHEINNTYSNANEKISIKKEKRLKNNFKNSYNSVRNLEKEKSRKINNFDENKLDKAQLNYKRTIKLVKNNLLFKGSHKNFNNDNLKNLSKEDYLSRNFKEKIKTKDNIKKSYSKNQINKTERNENDIINNNISFKSNHLYSIKKIIKTLYINKEKTNYKKAISKNKSSREKILTSIKKLDKNQNRYNDAKANNIINVKTENNYINSIFVNNSKRNNRIKDLGKNFKKREEISKINTNIRLKEKLIRSGKILNKLNKNDEKEINNQSSKKINKRKQLIYNTKSLHKRINKKDLSLDRNIFNTENLKENSKNKMIRFNNNNYYININKIFMSNFYNKIKTYIDLKPPRSNYKNIYKKGKKDTYLTINIDSLPRTKINTPTYHNSSIFSSLGADSREKKKKFEYKNQLKKIDIKTPNYMKKIKRKIINNQSKS